jgi:hypothetical protein
MPEAGQAALPGRGELRGTNFRGETEENRVVEGTPHLSNRNWRVKVDKNFEKIRFFFQSVPSSSEQPHRLGSPGEIAGSGARKNVMTQPKRAKGVAIDG